MFLALVILTAQEGMAMEKPEILSLDIISYEDFVQNDPEALSVLKLALHEKGIVGIKGIPEYKEMVLRFVKAARGFSALPEEVKESYAPNRALGELFLGYEKGKEKFKRPDGKWVVDDLKVSYYAYVPESTQNKWPVEMDLKRPFQDLGALMSEMGEAVMKKIGLLGPRTGITVEGIPRVGRLLYYCKVSDTAEENPFWCGAHFDHGLFTALIPASYFIDGVSVPEPFEAGLFVKPASDTEFKKVVADDLDVMLFQVGEYAQLATNDGIRATEHRVHKATGNVERYAMALFFEAPSESTIRSVSALTQDERYGGVAGDPCSYRDWSEASFNRYIVKEEEVQ